MSSKFVAIISKFQLLCLLFRVSEYHQGICQQLFFFALMHLRFLLSWHFSHDFQYDFEKLRVLLKGSRNYFVLLLFLVGTILPLYHYVRSELEALLTSYGRPSLLFLGDILFINIWMLNVLKCFGIHWYDNMIIFFNLLIGCILLINCINVNQSYISGTNPTSSFLHGFNLLIFCWEKHLFTFMRNVGM